MIGPAEFAQVQGVLAETVVRHPARSRAQLTAVHVPCQVLTVA